jgi:hypothetical protein
MKKVTAIVVYHNNEDNGNSCGYIIRNLTVITRLGEHITLYSDDWDDMDKKHPHITSTFHSTYKKVLQWLKNNSFYTSYHNSFGLRFYDIIWIEDKNPSDLATFGYSTIGETLLEKE